MNETVTLIGAFEKWVRLRPQSVAIAHRNRQWTYDGLRARVYEIAAALVEKGVPPFSRIGVYLPPSIELVASVLAILKVGAAYVPIDRSAPDEHVRFLAADANLRFIITDGVQRGGKLFLPIDSLRCHGKRVAASRPFPEIGREASAYVIYTSGSSGRPKGVVCSHENVLRLFASTARLFSFSPADRWTLFHSVAFDFSVWEMFGALLQGGTLVIVDPETARDTAEFANLLMDQSVTVLNQTPSAWHSLFRSAGARASDCLSGLRFVIFGGERLQVAGLRRWFEKVPRAVPKLINMYGITETTVHVTYREIAAEDVLSSTGSSPIGVAIGDLTLHLLNERLEPVADGEVGEICVAGPGVANGYLNRPGLTAERFVPNPFNDGTRAVLYRSGDCACQTPDGEFCYLGRLDRQLKIRGYRVEPGEIESVLLRAPGVAAAHVTAADCGTTDARLLAYVIPQWKLWPGAPLVTELNQRLRTFLKAALPSHMVPQLQLVAELPLTVNGKIDERRLAAQVLSRAGLLRVPSDSIEQRVKDIWLDVLKLQEVDLEAGLADLGAHSLAIVVLALRLYETFKVDIAINDFRDNVSIAQIAARIRSGQ